MTSIEHLLAFAKPLGVRILLENIPNDLCTPEKLVEFIHTTHFDDIGVCFDVGHAHIMGDLTQAFDPSSSTFVPPTFTITPRTKIPTYGREAVQSTGNRPWNCCAPHRTLRLCFWRSRAT